MIRQRAVLDAVRDAIFLADIDTGMIVDANRAAESLCGRSVAELRSLHHTQLHPPETREVDAQGLYVYASPVVEQVLGYTPEEVVGRMHFYDSFIPETRETVKAATFRAISRAEIFRGFQNWNVRKDGTIVALETNGVPV